MTIEIKHIGDKPFYVLPKVPVVNAKAVMNGGLLPASEIKKSTRSWNMKPVVMGHPTENGLNVSAAKESQIQNHIGFVTNARAEGDRLKADLFLDQAKIDAHPDGERLLQQARAGRPINVSSGYYSEDKEVAQGNQNGKAYGAIHKDIAPDHLAILLDEPGACSVNDGCGINVNQNLSEEIMNEQTPFNPEQLADSFASSLADFMQEQETKITANAALASGSAEAIQTCNDAIKKLSDRLDALEKAKEPKDKKEAEKPKTNAEGADNDEEDFETMAKKAKKDKKENESKARTLRTHSVKDALQSAGPQIITNSQYFMPSVHDFINLKQQGA